MLYRHISHIKGLASSAVAIGNFDGVHLGHKHIINNLLKVAKARGLRSCVVLFEPQPQQFFAVTNFTRVMSFRDKYVALTALGVDDVICLKFDANLANISHQDFYHQVLKNKLNMQALVIGSDFHFGKDRLGDIAFIKHQTNADNISLTVLTPKTSGKGVISSSSIRTLISENKLSIAATLLGSHYTISAKVMHDSVGASGNQHPYNLNIGKGISVAHILLSGNSVLNNGVYVVKVLVADKFYYGVAIISDAIQNDGKRVVELFLQAKLGSLYGDRIKICFLDFLREQYDASSWSEHSINIEQDIARASLADKIFINQL